MSTVSTKLKIIDKLPEKVAPFQWRPLTPDEIVRVDSQCSGPAKLEDQQHARYDPKRMFKAANQKVINEKQHIQQLYPRTTRSVTPVAR